MSFAQRRSAFFKSSLPGALPSLAGYLTSTLADVTSSATGTVDITGVVNATLANVTSSATGALAIAGTLSQTLANVTLSASGTVGAGITGDLAVTLANVTLSSAGVLAITGTASPTLANVTLSAVGALALTGALSKTLAAVTLTADGTGGILGQLNATLAAVTLSAAGLLTGSATPDGPTPAGKAGQHRKRRLLVEIDDQIFEVASPEHARAILERAREIAQAHAEELALKTVTQVKKRGSKPIKLPTPSISSPDPELHGVIQDARIAINAIYRTAAIDTELALLLASRLADEDEEETLLLLM